MKSITFLGSAGEVTGSSYLVTADDDSQILIDLGLFQGGPELTSQNSKPLGFKTARLKGVFLTHAHLDHCGRLPLLVYAGYFGKIYMTAPTRALVDLVLHDAAKISEEAFAQPLYSIDEVEKTLNMIEVIDLDTPLQLGSLTVTFKDAGHILGSVSIEIVDMYSIQRQKIVFSGDLGNSPEDIVKPTHYIDDADIVVMETTYGDSSHPVENPSQIIREEINAVESNPGVLLIPAFSLERTQELLHRIHHLKKEGKVKPDTPVFLDSPMGIHATEIFKAFRNFYNQELQSHTDDPFSFEGLVVTEEARDSREIIRAMEPKVIIAGSGMMTGGRILHHAANYLSQKTTRILFVGYQAEETLGNAIISGKTHVSIYDKSIPVRSHIREIASMSSHADRPKLLTWLRHIQNVSHVFLTHGDTLQRQSFAQEVNSLGLSVSLPLNGEEHSLSRG